MDPVQLVVALAAIASVVVAGLAFAATRKKNEADTAIDKHVQDFEELKTLNSALRAGLNDAQLQADRLNIDLAAATTTIADTQRQLLSLNTSLTIALANVALLSSFIEEHVPQDVPRPRLRRMG